MLRESLERQEEELQRRMACRAKAGARSEEANDSSNTVGSSVDTSPEEAFDEKPRTTFFTSSIESKTYDMVESVIKNWMEGLQRKIGKLEDERDKEMEELGDRFEMEEREVEAKLSEKYKEAKAKADKLPERIRLSSLKMLDEKHQAELMQAKTLLKDKQSNEKQRISGNHSAKLQQLMQLENSPEFFFKLKDALRNSALPSIEAVSQGKIPQVSAFSVNNRNFALTAKEAGKRSAKQISKNRKIIKENLATIDTSLINTKTLLNSFYIITCCSGSSRTLAVENS
eukprot:TRINITY_DN5238_c0_g2_i18.p1 TRINITY_DN5238_c0_g2~~TRINITY_DN5238_c0_g2_i18.p1  ORF type:complete len:285 (+),score=73.76 TRINITY_DN5238_c0_g2_i18:275-1129(+)